MEDFIAKLEKKITNSYDTDTLNDHKIELQRRKI